MIKMLKNKPERPLFDSDEDDNPIKLSCPPASSGDMTGLIPNGGNENDQLEAYNLLYPYLADDVSEYLG